jgi:hypothetical protein
MASIGALADPTWAEDAQDLALNTLEFVDDRYGESPSLTFIPVRFHVDSYSDSEAVVQVWGTTLGSGSKTKGFEQTWVTGKISLTWDGDTWLVTGQESVSGPTPRSSATTDDSDLDASLDGFQDYTHDSQPQP